MTRKDFILIAEVIRRSFQLDLDQRDRLAHETADALENTNPRFDYDRFIAAATEG